MLQAPTCGSVVATQSVHFASGGSGVPEGLKSSVSGSLSGSSLSAMPTDSCTAHGASTQVCVGTMRLGSTAGTMQRVPCRSASLHCCLALCHVAHAAACSTGSHLPCSALPAPTAPCAPHLAALRVHNGEGLPPVPLPRKQPVTQLEIDLHGGVAASRPDCCACKPARHARHARHAQQAATPRQPSTAAGMPRCSSPNRPPTCRCPIPCCSSQSIAAALAWSVGSPSRLRPLLLHAELTATPGDV